MAIIILPEYQKGETGYLIWFTCLSNMEKYDTHHHQDHLFL